MEDECPICYEILNQTQKKLRCGHVFHRACIYKWSFYSNTCPYCRDEFATAVRPPPRRAHPNYEMFLMIFLIVGYTYVVILVATA